VLAACAEASLDAPGAPGASADGEPSISVEPAPDRDLEARLRGIYAELDDMQALEVRVRNGVVHLGGVAESVAVMQRASRIAHRLEGVVDVQSDIESEPSSWLLASTWNALSGVGRSVLRMLPRLLSALLVFVPFVVLAWALGRWRRPLHLLGVRKLTGSVVSFVLRGVVLISGLVLALEVLGVAGIVGAVIGTLGLLGLVAGIALKDWVANYFPALMLGFHPPFESGDLVQVGDHEGRVVKITPRATVLMTTDGEQIRLPNAWLFQQTLVNLSHHRQRRLRFTMPLSTDADLQRAQELGVGVISKLHGVLAEPPPFMRTQSFGRGTVEVEFFAWVDQDAANFRAVASHTRRAVFETFVRGGVPLAEDTVVVRGKQAAPAAPRGSIAPAFDEAERLDEAFVKGQLAEATRGGADRERDLLAEGRSTSTQAHGDGSPAAG
jgi:small-conductance mechanosensitive channel